MRNVKLRLLSVVNVVTVYCIYCYGYYINSGNRKTTFAHSMYVLLQYQALVMLSS